MIINCFICFSLLLKKAKIFKSHLPLFTETGFLCNTLRVYYPCTHKLLHTSVALRAISIPSLSRRYQASVSSTSDIGIVIVYIRYRYRYVVLASVSSIPSLGIIDIRYRYRYHRYRYRRSQESVWVSLISDIAIIVIRHWYKRYQVSVSSIQVLASVSSILGIR